MVECRFYTARTKFRLLHWVPNHKNWAVAHKTYNLNRNRELCAIVCIRRVYVYLLCFVILPISEICSSCSFYEYLFLHERKDRRYSGTADDKNLGYVQLVEIQVAFIDLRPSVNWIDHIPTKDEQCRFDSYWALQIFTCRLIGRIGDFESLDASSNLAG